MDSLDDSYLLTGYEPKSYELMETYVESFTESLTHPQFSEQGFLEDGDYDDTALEEMLHNAHRVHVYHSRREGLSVGQSCQARINRHEFQAAYDRRSLLKLGEIVESQRERTSLRLELKKFNREINSFFKDRLLQQSLELREAHQKRLTEMEELRKFQCSNFDTVARGRLIEYQDTISELTGKIQQLQNENLLYE